MTASVGQQERISGSGLRTSGMGEIHRGSISRDLLHRICSLATRLIAATKNWCKNMKDSVCRQISWFKRAWLNIPIEFTYEPGQYASTLQQCVEKNNIQQLRAWVEKYSRYTPTQVLFGEYFTSTDMLRNYFIHQAHTAGVVKTDEEITLALDQFIDAKTRSLIILFHPDKHVNCGVDQDLMNACTRVITSAKLQLQQTRSAP